jgi:hypothetical protein
LAAHQGSQVSSSMNVKVTAVPVMALVVYAMLHWQEEKKR